MNLLENNQVFHNSISIHVQLGHRSYNLDDASPSLVIIFSIEEICEFLFMDLIALYLDLGLPYSYPIIIDSSLLQ